MMSVDIVVVNYRTPHDLTHFTSSLIRNEPTRPWTFGLANVSPLSEDVSAAHRSLAMMEQVSVARIDYHEFSVNVGYATAVNRVASSGRNDILAIFNADTRITEQVIDQCVDALLDHEDWAVVGPRQVDDRGRITHGGIFGTFERRTERGFHHRNSDELYGDIRDDAVTVSGAAYFIKRSVWTELTECKLYQDFATAEGAFLPTPHYWEETFCSYHAITHGYKVAYYGPAVMIHNWHRASPVGSRVDKEAGRSRTIFRAACDAHDIPHE